MSIEKIEAAELLSRNRFNVDEEEPHIVLNKENCKKCKEKPCLYVCPAVLYKLDKDLLPEFQRVNLLWNLPTLCVLSIMLTNF